MSNVNVITYPCPNHHACLANLRESHLSTPFLIYIQLIIMNVEWYPNIKKSNINKLQRVQNHAARIITGNFDYLNTNNIDLFRSLRWANVQERCDYFTAVLMYKAIHGLTPMYMTDNIVMAGETHGRDTRLSDSNDVNIPPHNSDVLKRSFIYNGSVIWNNLPDEIRMATDVADFKWRYKCLILNPLFENGLCPFACKLTENCVYFIRHFIPMS